MYSPFVTMWKFLDPPNVAVFTIWPILRGEDFIGIVHHDAEDGGWQFLSSSKPFSTADAAIVSLRNVAELDPTIVELADLPLGWRARRASKKSPCLREEA
jgi:hypothetical protein